MIRMTLPSAIEQNNRANRMIVRMVAVLVVLVLVVVIGVGVVVVNLALDFNDLAQEIRVQAIRNQLEVLESRKRSEKCVVAYLRAFAHNDNSRQPLPVIPDCEPGDLEAIETELDRTRKKLGTATKERNGG